MTLGDEGNRFCLRNDQIRAGRAPNGLTIRERILGSDQTVKSDIRTT